MQRSLLKNSLLWLLFLVASGCAVHTGRTEKAMPYVDPELVSGRAIFGEIVDVNESPAFDILGTTPEMVAYVGNIGDARLSIMRFNRLLKRLRKSGFFENKYDASITNTAAATFESKVGNCLSYTNLFVALAREVNLKVSFQIARIQHPTWNVDIGLLIRNNHINVLVEGPRFDKAHNSGYTIDFNQVDADPDARTTKVTDAFAASLFYANLSVDQILAGNDRLAFAYLQRGILSEPRNADLWINLGAFYGRHRVHESAIGAYLIAQQLKPREKIILSGMERSYRALGQVEKADILKRKVKSYRQRNPYFHFAVAQTAYEEKNYQRSLTAIDKAIRLKRRNPRFHYLKSLAERQLDDHESAGKSLRKAKRLGTFDDLQRRYGNMAASLTSLSD